MKTPLISFIIGCLLAYTSQAQTSFTGKPMYDIVTKQNGQTIGTITVELFPAIAPLHVANFDSLANAHFFDSTAFHRVIPGFMIQGGDPNSRHGPISTWGSGDPSQPNVNAEFSTAKHLRGTLSAARDADTNSANSQFFICVAASAWLNGQYSVYGRVVNGMNIADAIVSAPRDSNDNPLDKIEMFVNYVGSNDSLPIAPQLTIPASGSYSTAPNRVLKWAAQSDGIVYQVEVATDSLFTNIYKTAKVGANTYTVTNLQPLTQYFWRVKTNNGGHFSSYSDVWNFYVSALGINENKQIESTVFPNPSAGNFTFLDIKAGSTIEIFNSEGKLITTKIAISNNPVIDISNNPVGEYFYKINQNNTAISSGKLIITK